MPETLPHYFVNVTYIMLRLVSLTAVTALTFTGSAEARNDPSNKIVLMTPADLPELARQPGEAMLLDQTRNGKTLLYIEQDHGARLAIFDVTDLANIKEEDSVELNTPGSFDFVFSLGNREELVRFRNGQGEAVLDLHTVDDPTIKMIKGLKFQGSIERLGDDGFMIANQASVRSNVHPVDYQVVATGNAYEPSRVYDVNYVRQEITNNETGTTYLVTADGLYLIRRPAVEEQYKIDTGVVPG
jgi:hypothetical protein